MEAMQEIAANGTPSRAGKFTAAVLALRRDPRVQGTELEVSREGETKFNKRRRHNL